jgi:hypothetical protein
LFVLPEENLLVSLFHAANLSATNNRRIGFITLDVLRTEDWSAGMILSCRDRRTRDFVAGKKVKAFPASSVRHE